MSSSHSLRGAARERERGLAFLSVTALSAIIMATLRLPAMGPAREAVSWCDYRWRARKTRRQLAMSNSLPKPHFTLNGSNATGESGSSKGPGLRILFADDERHLRELMQL